MKAKLIKNGTTTYVVVKDDEVIGNMENLSLKNCQAIERGYDLDDLAENYVIENGLDLGCFDEVKNSKTDFKAGFQKAIELLGDKKFSINEVVELCKILISNPFERSGKTYQELTDSYVQSLQQTEWDVEIIMRNSRTGKIIKSDFDLDADEDGLCDRAIPKLDADGCLILKRI